MDMTIHTIRAVQPDLLKATMTINKKQYDVSYHHRSSMIGYIKVINIDNQRAMTSQHKLLRVKMFLLQTWMEMGHDYLNMGERNYG